MWDVVRGVCFGRYPRGRHRSQGCGGNDGSAERDALEAVREKIEGEVVVAHWSSVDTKTGVFDDPFIEAEIDADEAGFGPDRGFNDGLRSKFGF